MEYHTIYTDRLVNHALQLPVVLREVDVKTNLCRVVVKDDYIEDIPISVVSYFYRCKDGMFSYSRSDGPAIINCVLDTICFIYMNQMYNRTEDFCRAVGMSKEETLMWVLKCGNFLPVSASEFYCGWGLVDMNLDDL